MPYEFVDDQVPTTPAPTGRYVFADPPADPQQAQTVAALRTAAAKGDPTAGDYLHDLESGVLRGGARLAGLVPDAVGNVASLGVSAYDAAAHGLGADWSDLPKPWKPNATSSWLMDQMNKNPVTSTDLNRPDNAANRYLATAGEVGLGAGAAGAGAVGPTVRTFAGALPSAFAGQAVGEAQPFGANRPTANQLAAALTQLGTGVGIPAVTKLAIRGPSGAGMQQTASNFREAGAEPTVGQASEGALPRFLESGLAKFPGGSGVMHNAAAAQAQGMAGNMGGVVDALAPGGATPTLAGNAIGEGVTAGYKPITDAVAASKYAALDAKIPAGTALTPTNTIAAFNRATRVIPGAEATSEALSNPSLIRLRDAFMKDAGTGEGGALSMPYEAVKAMRSEIGSRLGESSLTSDIPRSQLKQVYAGLSQDMQGAAQNEGATREFNDANSYFKMKQGQLDDLDSAINKAGGPEAVFRGALSGTRDGATVLNRVMGEDATGMPILGEGQRNVVRAAVLDRMGKATPGNQNAAGDVFSPQTFLTNFNRLHEDAKSVLFGDSGNPLRDHVENMASVAQNLKDGSKVFANPSGTGPAMNQSETFKHLLDLGVGALAGHGLHQGLAPGAVAGAVGLPTAAYLGAKAMTSPTVVDWAGRPTISPAVPAKFALPAQLAGYPAAEDTLSDKQRRLADALRGLNGQ